jgi:hypothetical protein
MKLPNDYQKISLAASACHRVAILFEFLDGMGPQTDFRDNGTGLNLQHKVIPAATAGLKDELDAPLLDSTGDMVVRNDRVTSVASNKSDFIDADTVELTGVTLFAPASNYKVFDNLSIRFTSLPSLPSAGSLPFSFSFLFSAILSRLPSFFCLPSVPSLFLFFFSLSLSPPPHQHSARETPGCDGTLWLREVILSPSHRWPVEAL